MADPLRVVIADDEPVARGMARDTLERDARFHVAGEAEDGHAAVTIIRELDPDLVLLDVRMPGPDGFEVCRTVGVDRMPAVVFVTAHSDFALEAFRVHALDYVVKPFDGERLTEALEHAFERVTSERAGRLARRLQAMMEGQRSADAPPRRGTAPRSAADRLLIPTPNGARFIPTGSIDFIQADRNYAELHLGTEVLRIKRSLRRLEGALDPRQFIRIHRSTIVNVERVVEIQPWVGGDHIALLDSGKRLRVSRGFRDRILGTRI